MTSTTAHTRSSSARLRGVALVAVAAGTAVSAAACGSGQISQTANQVAAVDGGNGSAGDISVNDVRIVRPDGGEQASVGYTASYTGTGLDARDGIRLTSVTVDGHAAQIGQAQPIRRGCALVSRPSGEGAPESAPATGGEAAAEASTGDRGVCISPTTTTVTEGAGALAYGRSVPVHFAFSDGRQVDVLAGVVTAFEEAGKYTRPADEPAAEHH